MQRFLYVEARDVSMPEDRPQPLLSFASVIVMVEDVEAAYTLGPHHLREQFARHGDPYDHCTGRFLNDYVTEIPA